MLPRIRLSDTTTPGMQWVGREELLERERALWDECVLACDGRSSALTFNLSRANKKRNTLYNVRHVRRTLLRFVS